MTDVQVTAPLLLTSPQVRDVFARADVTVWYTSLLLATYTVLYFTGWALPRYHSLNKQEQGEWNVRVVSSINATFMTVGSIICLLDAPNLSPKECIFGFKPVTLFFCHVFLGYLLFDLILEIWGGAPVLRTPSAVLHHLLWVFLNSYVLAYDLMPITFAWLTLGEISTPSLNFRWFLAVTKREKSTLYLVNGAALTVLFFIARIIVYGAGLVHTWSLRRFFMAPEQPYMHTGVVLLATVGYALNIYWMGLILKGVVRALKRKHK